MRRFVLLLAIVANVICEHQGSQYLNKAVRDLRQLNVYQTLRRGDVEILSSTSQVERDFPTQEFVDRRDTNNKGEVIDCFLAHVLINIDIDLLKSFKVSCDQNYY